MNRTTNRILAAVAVAVALPLLAAPAANAADKPGCVTKAEYRRVAIDATQAHVERVFGATGRQVADLSVVRQEVATVDANGNATSYQTWTHHDGIWSYRKCGRWGVGHRVLVGMEAWNDTEPLRVWLKVQRDRFGLVAPQPAPAAPAPVRQPEEPVYVTGGPDPVLTPPTE